MPYMELLQQRFTELNTAETARKPLSTFVDRIIDECDRFFTDHPGDHAIFMQVQGKMPELEAIESAADAQLIQDLATFLSEYYSGLYQFNMKLHRIRLQE